MSGLAGRAEIGAALPYHDSLDGCAAPGTGRTLLVRYVERVVSGASLPVGKPVRVNARALPGDCPLEHVSDCLPQTDNLLMTEFVRRRQRMYANLEERFIRIHVPYARDDMLVK